VSLGIVRDLCFLHVLTTQSAVGISCHRVGIGQILTAGAVPCYLADYAAGMRKTRSRKRDGRKRKTAGDAHNKIAHIAESALPLEKSPSPSAKQRLRRRAKLIK
jgi:hypothetical protein